jgi:hypothetical protein
VRRNILIASGGVFLAAIVGFITLTRGEAQGIDQSHRSEQAVVQRGEYLVKIMDCNDCHMPWKMGPQGPEPDMTRFLSGHPEEIGPLPNAKAAEPFVWSGFGSNTARKFTTENTESHREEMIFILGVLSDLCGSLLRFVVALEQQAFAERALECGIHALARKLALVAQELDDTGKVGFGRSDVEFVRDVGLRVDAAYLIN